MKGVIAFCTSEVVVTLEIPTPSLEGQSILFLQRKELIPEKDTKRMN